MASFGANYNPSAVMMGRPTSGSGPYLWSGPGKLISDSAGKTPISGGGSPIIKRPMTSSTDGGMGSSPASGPTTTTTPGNVLAPRTVRATGAGPFDPAYRQNLASYAGGQFAGNLAFNPTDPNSFPGMPTGGGTAPVTGMPQSLMDMALAGQGFSWTPPQPAQTATQPPKYTDMQAWMDQFMRNGRGGRMGSIL